MLLSIAKTVVMPRDRLVGGTSEGGSEGRLNYALRPHKFEQYVGHALRVADAVVLLQHGEVVYDGSVSGLGDVAQRLLAKSPE